MTTKTKRDAFHKWLLFAEGVNVNFVLLVGIVSFVGPWTTLTVDSGLADVALSPNASRDARQLCHQWPQLFHSRKHGCFIGTLVSDRKWRGTREQAEGFDNRCDFTRTPAEDVDYRFKSSEAKCQLRQRLVYVTSILYASYVMLSILSPILLFFFTHPGRQIRVGIILSLLVYGTAGACLPLALLTFHIYNYVESQIIFPPFYGFVLSNEILRSATVKSYGGGYATAWTCFVAYVIGVVSVFVTHRRRRRLKDADVADDSGTDEDVAPPDCQCCRQDRCRTQEKIDGSEHVENSSAALIEPPHKTVTFNV